MVKLLVKEPVILVDPSCVLPSLSTSVREALVDQQCPYCSIPSPLSIIVAYALADVYEISDILSLLTLMIFSLSFLHEEKDNITREVRITPDSSELM